MVEIREENSDSESRADGQQQQPTNASNSQQQSPPRQKTAVEFVKENTTETLCFGLRIATIYLTLCYILPFSSPYNQKMAYSKAFAAAAATNAFRLHQRMRGSTNRVLSRVFLSELFIEDSAHYLFYCLIFVMSSPVTMALLPITLFAALHALNFGIKFATEIGYGNLSYVLKARELINAHSQNLLSTIACAEIFVFPIFFAMIFMGKANILFPFIYYRFLTLRYLSRRNPYTRETFTQLKLSVYSVAGHPSCPGIVRNIIYKAVALIERLAPQA